MQLYKSRSFGDYFSDTFSFIKNNGKHFYRNYFLINGIFILILLIMTYFFGRMYSTFLASSMGTGTGTMSTYMEDNLVGFALFFFLFMIVFVLIVIINYAYTPVYFILYEEKNGNDFTSKDLINALKKRFGKVILYTFASLLISIPLLIIAGIAVVGLAVTMIGIPLILIVFGWLGLFYYIAFIEYLKSDKGVFECFSYSFSLSFKKFWATTGCIALFYLMIQVVQTVITLVPYLLGFASIYSGFEVSDDPMQGNTSTFVGMLTLVYMISFFLNLFLSTVLETNQSIIYYSLKEENENIHSTSVIDEIGNS
ncbi:hypothetical protein OOZ15_15990 [Galbibacter sp. EGI 63066]|uniref:hypothetical protein n=1 Tax=Galbibacter sp. EGI 63066 TaxID=2993559 RepID=UPI002248A18C|nr:hypothetical protein [Galbibacter sp. EGI 63066]MCX2681456.1 hypothetical protein [Galbibacter sp. EGI 63066]